VSGTQGKTPVSPNPAETPLEIPGFEAYSAIAGILLLVLIFKIKEIDKRNIKKYKEI